MNQNLDHKEKDHEENNNPVADGDASVEAGAGNSESKKTETETEMSQSEPAVVDVDTVSEPAATEPETATAVSSNEAVESDKKAAEPEENTSSMTGFVVGAIVLALLMIGGVLFFMSGTNVTEPSVATDEGTGVSINDLLGLDEGESTDPIVEVNGVVLEREAYNRLRQQLAGQAQQQGMNLNSTSTIEQIDTQALETLINTEVLRQAAVAAGGEVDTAAVDARFDEIVEQVGGADALASTLEEVGQTESALREDVQQEILVQGYIDAEIAGTDLVATEEEVTALYNQAGGAEAGLPPLEEVRAQVEQQIEMGKRQEAINTIVDSLREEAAVEVLI